MRRMRVAAGAVLLLALDLGCATVVTDSTRTEVVPSPPKTRDDPIEVVSGDRPAWPYRVIGSVRARVKLSESAARVAPPPKVLEALKREARALGGDALLGLTVTPESGGGSYLDPTGAVHLGSSELWTALVIVRADSR